MNCPVDGATLQMTDRQGIEIDYCPQCRGVWLDRGELDKLIERAAPLASGAPPTSTAPRAGSIPPAPGPYGQRPVEPGYGDRPYRRDDDDDDWDDDDRRRYGQYDSQGRKRRRKSFLDDLFDF